MAKWIIVVDDDTANLKMAGHILSKNNMRVTALKSGKSFLDYVESNGMPVLVLRKGKMGIGMTTSDHVRMPGRITSIPHLQCPQQSTAESYS